MNSNKKFFQRDFSFLGYAFPSLNDTNSDINSIGILMNNETASKKINK